jgi:hypothetical protein
MRWARMWLLALWIFMALLYFFVRHFPQLAAHHH